MTSEPLAPRVGRNGSPAIDARSPPMNRNSLQSRASISPEAIAAPYAGANPSCSKPT